MKTKLSGFAMLSIGLAAIFAGATAHAEIGYLHHFAGWQAATHPDGTIRITRTDRRILASSIYLYPAREAPITSQEEAQALMETIKQSVAAKHKQCAPISAKELKPNGMGLSVQDRDAAPKCVLWISGTKQGRLFANLRLDDGTLGPQSLPIQQTASVFVNLTTARMQGEEFLLEKNGTVDLKQFAERIPTDNIPVHMVIAHWPAQKYFSPEHNKAIPLLENQASINCSNWDPSFYSPAALAAVKAKGLRTLPSPIGRFICSGK